MTSAEPGVVGHFLSRHPRPFAKSLGVLLAEARQTTGRSVRTGVRDRGIYHGDLPLYAGTVAYLKVVDWVGECLRPVDRASDARAPFLRALELFTDLPEAEREALYGFRCALLAPFVPVTGDARPRSYRFMISTDGSSPLVRVQDTPWDGDMGMYRETTSTVVDLETFGTTVEEMYAHLWRLHAEHRLTVALPDGVEALARRMTCFWTPA